MRCFSCENWPGGYQELKFKRIFKSDQKRLSYKQIKSCFRNFNLLVTQLFLVRFENPFKLKLLVTPRSVLVKKTLKIAIKLQTSKMSTALTILARLLTNFEVCHWLAILRGFSWENWPGGYQELKFKRIFKLDQK